MKKSRKRKKKFKQALFPSEFMTKLIILLNVIKARKIIWIRPGKLKKRHDKVVQANNNWGWNMTRIITSRSRWKWIKSTVCEKKFSNSACWVGILLFFLSLLLPLSFLNFFFVDKSKMFFQPQSNMKKMKKKIPFW